MRKIEKKIFDIFHPWALNPGHPCISAPGPNLENRFGQYVFLAKLTLLSKFQPSRMSGLACGRVGFEKTA